MAGAVIFRLRVHDAFGFVLGDTMLMMATLRGDLRSEMYRGFERQTRVLVFSMVGAIVAGFGAFSGLVVSVVH